MSKNFFHTLIVALATALPFAAGAASVEILNVSTTRRVSCTKTSTLGLGYDVDALYDKAKLIPQNWQKRLPHNSSPYTSTIMRPRPVPCATNRRGAANSSAVSGSARQQ